MDYLTFKTWALSYGYGVNYCIDRIDSNKNYEPDNCRWVTPTQNSQNTRARAGTSAYKGVHKKRKKWAVQIRYEGQKLWKGVYASEEEAAKVYDKWAMEYFGEHAHLNFPKWRPE